MRVESLLTSLRTRILFLSNIGLRGPENPFLCKTLNILGFHPNTVVARAASHQVINWLLNMELELLSVMREVSGHEELASSCYCAGQAMKAV